MTSQCIADEMARKANIVHMGDSANCKAAKVQQVISGCRAEEQKCRQGQIMWEYAGSV